MKKFYRVRVFQKLKFLVEVSKISQKIKKNDGIIDGGAPAQRVIRAEPGWRFTARCHGETRPKSTEYIHDS